VAFLSTSVYTGSIIVMTTFHRDLFRERINLEMRKVKSQSNCCLNMGEPVDFFTFSTILIDTFAEYSCGSCCILSTKIVYVYLYIHDLFHLS
jgi:hypothetical protein